MDYRQNFFYEYINILVDQGAPKYDAIDRYIWEPKVPYDYKTMPCIQEEMNHAIQLLNAKKNINKEINY